MRPRPPLVSQNGEDHLLLEAFEDHNSGFFVDVGAFDGVHLSNTYALEQLGWTGICIEPSPRAFSLLAMNRPRSTCIQAAAGSTTGIASLLMDPTMLLSSLGPEADVRERFETAARARGLSADQFVQVDVEVVTLDEVLRRARRHKPIDLVSIDVEGAEEDVLNGLDLIVHEPRVIVIEANDEDAKQMLTRRLGKAGYTLCRSLRSNLFFSKEERLVHRLRRTHMNCFIPRNIHPFGVEYTHPDQRVDRVVMHGRGIGLDELAEDWESHVDGTP